MPNFPAIPEVGTTNVDAGTDQPRNARADIKQAIDNVNDIRTAFAGKELAATGDEQDWSRQQYIALQTLTDGANISWNCQTQQVAEVTLGGNRNLLNPTNMRAGATYVLIVRQDGTGSRTLAFGDKYRWSLGLVPSMTFSPNSVDILSFVSDGTYMYGAHLRDLK